MSIPVHASIVAPFQSQKRLQRNELARLYHWQQRNRLTPLNSMYALSHYYFYCYR